MMQKKFLIGLTCAFFFLTVFTSATVLARVKDTVRLGMHSDATTVNPFQYKTVQDEVTFLSMFQGLKKDVTQTGDPVFCLAESIKIMENGKDIWVKLRKGPKFYTGDPVTAHDVRFSWAQHLDRKNKSLLRSVYRKIKDVEIIDDYTFIYRFKKPFAPWEILMTMSIGPKKYFEKVGREAFTKHPLGSGPFSFVERKIGESITLQAVKNHHDYKVDFKILKIIIVPDEMTRVAMLETEELDLIYRILPHQVKRLERNKRIKIKRSDQTPNFFEIAFRTLTDDIIKDRKLRLAFQYAINRQEIVDMVFFGEGYPHYMNADHLELGYDPTYKVEFNPEKARELVKQSSYKPGTPLILTRGGEMVNSLPVCTAIQNYMKDVGVTIKMRQMEVGTFLALSRKQDPRLGHLTTSTWPGSRDPIWRLMFSVKSDGFYCTYPGRPDREVLDKLIEAQAVEMDKEKRLVILKKIHEIYNQDPSRLPLFGLNMIYGMANWLDYNWIPKNYEPSQLWTIRIVK
ncbi:MAG: ABC transporter substrate-binding protein [Deltaproteobacteria bacterium]|nr:ABC transporter substrate-binding protein [Deltaproteobacteria bacterium]